MTRRPDSGFALPMVVFLIAIVTLLLTAAFTKVSADRRIADASGANVNAMAIAKAALQQYLGTRTLRPADGDSVRINVTGGYGDVIATVITRPPDTLSNWIFVMRAVGHVIDPTQGKDPQAVRTIAQFAQWQTGRMDTKAAYVAIDGFNQHNSAADTIYGADSASCGAPTVYALMTKNINPPNTNAPNVITGTGSSPSVQNTWTMNALVDSLNLDWFGILAGGITPDYTTYSDNATYPTYLISGSLTTPANMNGTGILIVQNDLTITGLGTARWKGIILVGGRIIFQAGTHTINWVGGTRIQGMAIVGLNQGGTKTDLGDYPAYIQYNSCRIRDALSKLTGFAPITNGWVDNWATY